MPLQKDGKHGDGQISARGMSRNHVTATLTQRISIALEQKGIGQMLRKSLMPGSDYGGAVENDVEMKPVSGSVIAG